MYFYPSLRNFILLGTIFFVFFTESLTGSSFQQKKAAEISEIIVISFDKNTGAVKLQVSLESNLDIDGTLLVKTGYGMKIEDGLDLTKEISVNVRLAKNNSVRKIFTLRYFSKTVSAIEVFLQTPNAPNGYSKVFSKYVKFYDDGKEARIVDPRKNKFFRPLKEGEDFFIKRGTDGKSLKAASTYTVNISGRVKSSVTDLGVYGNDVVFFFRNTSNPGDWYHPISENQQNVTYDVIDTEGNFNFIFSFDGDLSDYNELIILVSTTNHATILPVPADGYIIQHEYGFSTYYNESDGIIQGINGGDPNI